MFKHTTGYPSANKKLKDSQNKLVKSRPSRGRTSGHPRSRNSRHELYERLEQRQLLAGLTLLDTILPDSSSPQQDAHFGHSVALSDDYRFVGAPDADVGPIRDSGQVFVYDSSNTLVETINSPKLADDSGFGSALAVDGDTLAVGSPGNRTVYVYGLSSGKAVLKGTIDYLDLNISTRYGSSLAVSGDTLVLGDPNSDIGDRLAGAVHIFDLTDGEPVFRATLANPSPDTFDYFGGSVAISNDTVVVGAYRDSAGFSNSGGAYVYDLSNDEETLIDTLNNPTPGFGDRFGYSVTLSGDTLVVSAPGDDTEEYDSGSVYVYDLSNGPAELVETVTNPSPFDHDFFGDSVSVSGDVLVVGTPKDNVGRTDVGTAYIYDLSTGTAQLNATLNNSTPAYLDYFGQSVSVFGDTVIVGIPNDNLISEDVGSVGIYQLSGDAVTFEATLSSPVLRSGDSFGRALTIEDSTIVVGAFLDDTFAEDSGAVYVYDLLPSGDLALVARIFNPTPGTDDYFGVAVAFSGNILAVSATGDNTGSNDSGSVYVYDLSDGDPVLIDTVNNPSPQEDDSFGSSIAISGNTLVIGADEDDTGHDNSGIAYIYEVQSNGVSRTATLNNPNSMTNSRFGKSAAIDGSTLIIGAPEDNADAGKAHVYDLSNEHPILIATLDNPTPKFDDNFGTSVAVEGGTLVVGASSDDTLATNAGSAYVYRLSDDVVELVDTLIKPRSSFPNTDSQAYFGGSLAISESKLVVGALGRERAYVYDMGSSTAVFETSLTSPTPLYTDNFGSAAISGDTILIGASGDNTLNFRQGAVYRFGTGVPDILLGDFDNDQDVDLDDLDRFNGNIGLPAINEIEVLDLDEDGFVGANDFERHYSTLIEIDGAGNGTLAGDANLDGKVDVLGDAFILVANLGKSTTSWSSGDFDGNGIIDVLGDAFLLIENVGNSVYNSVPASTNSLPSVNGFFSIEPPTEPTMLGTAIDIATPSLVFGPADDNSEDEDIPGIAGMAAEPARSQLTLAGIDRAFESGNVIDDLIER